MEFVLEKLLAWGGSVLLAGLGCLTSAFWWAMRRHISRVDEHGARISALEQGKVGRDELEAAIARLEDVSRRNGEQTNDRLDRIYDLMVQSARGRA